MVWWKSLFQKRPLAAQLDSELRFHIEELTKANIAAGLTPDEARRRAILEFGGKEQIKEELRDVYRVAVIEAALANLSFAIRFAVQITVVLADSHFDAGVGHWREQRGILSPRRHRPSAFGVSHEPRID